jgi:ABC-type Mn2+/Zn2+ transport system ATPase subunit
MSNYFIEKVQVEGGFLDGLDLSLKSGLNTVIGARGTGKSTLVELIRYCLGVSGHTQESSNRALSHARSVLKDGQVTLTLTDGETRISICRSADGQAEDLPVGIRCPLIFSQTEVETVGLLSSGRVKLLDGFLSGLSGIYDAEISAIARIHAYSAEMNSIGLELSSYEDRLLSLPNVEAQLKELAPKEKEIAAISDQAAQKTGVLNELTVKYSAASAISDNVNYFLSSGRDLEGSVEELLAKMPQFPNASDFLSKADDVLFKAKVKRNSASKLIVQALVLLKESGDGVNKILHSLSEAQSSLNIESQKLRLEIEALKEGAGEVVRKGQNLRKEKAHYETMREAVVALKVRLKSLRAARDCVLDALDAARSERAKKRLAAASYLTGRLSPKIRIAVDESAGLDEYINVLMNSLKGSGIQYKDLAPAVAEAIPPRELLNCIESADVDRFVSHISISKERASRVINSLRSSLGEISTVLLGDDVSFELLDGTDYKEFSTLSTGQRCTVILPIILEHVDSILIVDQPEDHIDNAFIVDTLISAILRRAGDGQVVVTTHNANVPVLGEAKQVVHLDSDGARGFVLASGSLESSEIVKAITNVMEGGREAFDYRAKFYEKGLQ